MKRHTILVMAAFLCLHFVDIATAQMILDGSGNAVLRQGDPGLISHRYDGGAAINVYVSGVYAYLANYDDGLRIYDITDPSDPLSIGHIDNGGAARGVYVSGGYAYLANGDDGLRIYSITIPSNPLNFGHIDDGGYASGVYVSGTYAYLANYDDGLRIYDITDPFHPLNVGHIDDGGVAYGVYVSGAYAYLANLDDGLRIYDITNPSYPLSIGHIDDGGFAYGVYVSGAYAYLANAEDGLRIYDITYPLNPLSIGHISDWGSAWGVYVSGTYAYLCNGPNGLRIYDIADPSAPLNIGHIDDGGLASYVYVSGTYAYLANQDDGLRIYDISGIDAPAGFIGALASTNVDVTQNLIVGNDVYIKNALAVGPGGLHVDRGNGISSYGQLHVKDWPTAEGDVPENHVAIIENAANLFDFRSDVLALVVNIGNPGADVNFITFTDISGNIGAIEGNGAGGIQLNTTGGDFAEYLPKEDMKEELEPGDIVGLFAGKVTRNTLNAERLMAITTSPAVLGNQPPEDKVSSYAKVAFVGQAPVKVSGPVRAGDWIIASGREDGTGIAVSAEDIKPDHLAQAVGRAMESSPEAGVKRVSVIVGLSSMQTMYKMLQEKDAQISRLEAKVVALKEMQISRLESRLATLENMMQQQQYALKNHAGAGY